MYHLYEVSQRVNGQDLEDLVFPLQYPTPTFSSKRQTFSTVVLRPTSKAASKTFTDLKY